MGLFGRATNLLKGFLRAPARGAGGDRRSRALLDEELRRAMEAEATRKGAGTLTPEPGIPPVPETPQEPRKPSRRTLGPEDEE